MPYLSIDRGVFANSYKKYIEVTMKVILIKNRCDL